MNKHKPSWLKSWMIWLLVLFIFLWYSYGFETAMIGTGLMFSGLLFGILLLDIILSLKWKEKIKIRYGYLFVFIGLLIGEIIYFGFDKILLFIPAMALPIVLASLFFKTN